MCNAFQSEAPRSKRSPATSFVGRFEANAELLGEERLYSWLTADASEEATLSYAEMRARCRAVCVALRRRWGASTGDRLMLVYAPGLELLVAFFGCQYAAVIAVPYYPPVLPLTPLPSVGAKRLLADGLAKVKRIAESCTPHAFLSTRTYVRASWLASKLVREAECSWPPEWTWRCTDEVSPRLGRGDADWLSEWLPGRCEPSPRDEVSFLQYTSGSTGHPKGVAIGTHNLLANVLAMCYASPTTNSFPPPGSRIAMVSWLPQYHDFGLIAGSLSTAMQGYRSDLLSPFTFIKHPISWLLAISRLEHSHLVISPSPNFGFALCTRRAKPHHIARLQLSHWKAAFNGAEPIRTRTLADFDAKFAPCGWRPSSWACLYGLAETCVYGCGVAEPPVVLEVPRSRLGPGDAPMPLQPGDDHLIEFPGCFVEEAALTGQRFAISHPETGLPLPDGVVGEVRIRGASVALGYWQQPALSEQTFRTPLALPAPPSALREEKGAAVGGRGGGGGGGGELPPCGKGEPFLCTGDLGFVWESRLYIVGRIKDILCIRGRTLHAHDIETCAEASHPAMRPGCCAALPVVPPDTGQDTDGEALVLVAELKPEAEKAAAAGDGAAIAEAVRDGVREAEGVKAHAVVLLRARTILKTTSGKLRRRELRLAYAELDVAVRAAAAAAADGRKAAPAQKLRVPLDAVLHFWRDASKPARKAADPDAEPGPAVGGGRAVSLQEGSEKVQLPVRSVPRNDSELSALGTARGSEPSREPSRGDAAGKAEAELDDAGGGGPSATEQLGSGAELDTLDGERREAGREMMLAAASGAAEAGCSPGMGWALRRTYLLAWGLHIPVDASLHHATSAPAGGRASGSELGSCVEGLAELLHGCNLSGSMAAAGAWFEEQGLDTVAELKKARMEADFVAALQLKPGKERVLLADIDSFY